MAVRIEADFNGLFGNFLCLSHTDHGTTDTGEEHEFVEGEAALAFIMDSDTEGRPAYLVARGRVVRSPDGQCGPGSVWSLEIDEQGVRHVPTLDED